MIQLLVILLLLILLLCLSWHGTCRLLVSVEFLRTTLIVIHLRLLLHLLWSGSAAIHGLLGHLLIRLLNGLVLLRGSAERVCLTLRRLFWRGSKGIRISLRLSLRMSERSMRLLLLEHHLVLIL